MRILLACEESQAVTKELRAKGHEAFSCDILPCSGGHPEWHLQQDVTELLKQKWDMIIAFPPCTYLTVTCKLKKSQPHILALSVFSTTQFQRSKTKRAKIPQRF